MNSDERKEPRAASKLAVKYEKLNAFFAEYAQNISKGGMFIQTEQPLPIDTLFEFELTVPGMNEPLRLNGKVKWVRPKENATEEHAPGMGIEFVYSSDQEREHIESKVEKLMIEELGEVVSSQLLGKKTN